ncbi:MAG: DUF5615 family PIN-like protein [Phycisphaeraceae bacterium]
MARFFADENFPMPVVAHLRRLGHDVVTAFENGLGERRVTDSEILQHATTDHRRVVTLNRRHFIQLHQTGVMHAGVVVCTFDADFEALARRIHEAVEKADLPERQLIRITRSKLGQDGPAI